MMKLKPILITGKDVDVIWYTLGIHNESTWDEEDNGIGELEVERKERKEM